MPSYSNPSIFMPSTNAYATESALGVVDSTLANAPQPFFNKAVHGLDIYSHLMVPVVIRSGGRAITRGGYLDKGGLGPENDLPWWKNEWLEKYSPRAWRRTATAWSFDPRNMGGPNFVFFKAGAHDKGQLTGVGERLQRHLRGATKYDEATGLMDESHWIRKAGILEKSGNLAHLWDPRMLSRISGAGEFSRMDRLTEKNAQSLVNYLRAGQNEGLAGGLESYIKYAGTDAIAGRDAAMLTRLGVRGALSGRMQGALEGLRFGREDVLGRLGGLGMEEGALSESVQVGLKMGESIRSWAVDAGGEKLAFGDILRGRAVSAAEKAGTEVGGDIAKKLGARLLLAGAEVGGALGEGGLNPIMDIMAIASIAQLGFDVAHIGVTAVANEAKAAMTSFRGDISRTPGNGFGFHDTVASATARQRGLQAIAASRLNARSILGNEAGPMATHFMGSEMGY